MKLITIFQLQKITLSPINGDIIWEDARVGFQTVKECLDYLEDQPDFDCYRIIETYRTHYDGVLGQNEILLHNREG